MAVKIVENCIDEQRKEIKELIAENEDIFATNLENLPRRVTRFEHTINTGDYAPIK